MALKKPGDIFKHPQAQPVFTNLSNIEEQLSKAEVLLPKEKVDELRQQLESVSNSIDTSLSEVSDGSVDYSVVRKELDRFNTKITHIEEDLNEKVDDLRQKHTDIKTGIQIVQTRQNNIHPEKLKEEVIHRVKNILIGDIGQNIRELEERVDVIKGSYKQTLNEGLLNEPPTVNNSDPLTPLNKKFVTLDEFQSHYKIFINRIQTQLATLGGGGAVNIREMDDVDLSTAKVNGKYLKYNSTTNKWEGADATGGGGSGITTAHVNTGTLVVAGVTTHNGNVQFPGAAYNILWDKATSKIKFDDSAQCVFGSASGGDMKLFHASGNSTIRNETGQFRIAGNDIRLQTQNHSEDYITCTDGGDVKIFFNDNEKIKTTNHGVDITGIATATTFSGSGASLTSLNASNLSSGTVPTARLGSGTANSSVFLRGDNTWAAAGGGGSLDSRGTTSATTGSIAQNASGDITISTRGKSFSLLKVAINAPAWVVLYVDSASRSSDSSRTEGTDPAPGSGVLTEVSTTASGSSTFLMSPAVLGWNNDGTPAAQVYAKVKNKRSNSGSNTITVTLTTVGLEA